MNSANGPPRRWPRSIADNDLAGALEPNAVDIRRNDPISELMVLNAAFLVDRPRIKLFEAAVQDLDRGPAAGLAWWLGPTTPTTSSAFGGLSSERKRPRTDGDGLLKNLLLTPVMLRASRLTFVFAEIRDVADRELNDKAIGREMLELRAAPGRGPDQRGRIRRGRGRASWHA